MNAQETSVLRAFLNFKKHSIKNAMIRKFTPEHESAIRNE
jgi:hypothetical protein